MTKSKSSKSDKARKSNSAKARKGDSARARKLSPSKKLGPAKKKVSSAVKPARTRATSKRDQVCDGEIDLKSTRGAKTTSIVLRNAGAASPPTRSRSVSPAAAEAQPAVTIRFGPNARQESVTELSRQVLLSIMQASSVNDLLITSTSRSPAEQARVMFNNIKAKGVAHQKTLYGPTGDKIIDVFVASRNAGKTDAQIKADMERKIIQVGPTNVSRHASDPNVLCVFDISPGSISRPAAFENAVNAESRVSKFLKPPTDPAYHLEIPQS